MADPAGGAGGLDLLGVEVPLPSGQGTEMAEMARCFVDEFVRMGWNDEDLLGLFRDPFYRGPHLVYRQCGEAYVRELLAEARSAVR